jgi:hypothetical protein
MSIVATIVACRTRSGRRLVATAQVTKARHRKGRAYANNHGSHIESCLSSHVPPSATTISPRPPNFSAHRARLKNTHHTRMARVKTSEPITANPKPFMPGMAAFTPNRNSNCRATRTMPGHSLKRLWGVCSPVRVEVMWHYTFIARRLFRFYRAGLS